MAKTNLLILNRHYNHSITLLEQKISNNTSYHDVIKKQIEKKRIQKIEDMKLNHQAYLFSIESKTLSKEAYLEFFSQKEIETLNTWDYWKKRELAQTKHRMIFNDESKKDSAESTYQKKLETLRIKYDTKKVRIDQKYTISLSNETIKAYLNTYPIEKARLEKELNDYIETLNKQDVIKIEQQYKEIHRKNELLEAKLVLLKAKKNALGLTADIEMDDQVILRLDKLRMQFGGLVAVDDLSFDVKKGEIFGLIGPNGAGKTTVFNCITQFYKSNGGVMSYRDKNNDVVNLNHYQVHDVIKLGIVRTFQNVELIWELSILDNLLIASHTLYQSNFFGHLMHTSKFRREEEILKAKALKILTDLGLLAYKDFYPLGLPYGTLKLIELARTLMTNPKLIILDEPAAGLNDLESDKLAQTIKKIQKEYDCTIFLVEHDMGLVMKLCDTICAISFGKKLAIGTPKEIQSNPVVQEAYLGGE